MANEKKLEDLSKEELITLCKKQEQELKASRECNQFYIDEKNKLQKKLETLKNIIDL